jgi:TonB-dependent receptor
MLIEKSCYGRFFGGVLVALFFVFICQPMYAQVSGSIRGQVVDGETGDPLIGANVIIVNTSLGVATDINGEFYLSFVPAGKVSIKVSSLGYATMIKEIEVVSGAAVKKQIFRLPPQTITGEAVTVTAQARGQDLAISQQLAAKSIVNVVSSEKMKELPDANIAESIGRLPGISLQRNAGEASAVVVRGLSPKYNNVTIEGVPMNSTNSYDRGIDLSLLGDDMVRGVEVSKTLRPDMDADALGGTVNLTLKTAPADFHYDLRGNGGYTKLNNSYRNFKLAGTASDRFFGDKVGLLVQGSFEEKQLPANEFDASYAQPQVANLIVNSDTTKINNMSTQSATLKQTETRRNRYGISAMLDYTSDLVDVKIFNVYDQKNDSTITRSNQQTFSNEQFLSQVFESVTKTEQRTHSIQFLFKLGKTELPLSLSYTRSDVRTPNAQQFDILGKENTGFPPTNTGMLNFAQPITLMNFMGVQQPGDSAHPGQSLLQEPYMSNYSLTDQEYDAKADWNVPFKISDNLFGTLSVGGKYHSVDRASNNNKYGLYIQYGQGAGARNDLIAYLSAHYPGFHTDPTNQTGIFASNFTDPNYTGGQVLGYAVGPQYNIYQLLSIGSDYYGLHGPSTSSNEYLMDGVNSYNLDYTDKESTVAGYIMGEFNIGNKLTIIPGARFQEEKTDISAYHLLINGLSPTGLANNNPPLNEAKRDNPDWYPSVNIKYKATDNVQFLAAAYKSVSLPSFTDISPVLIFNAGASPVALTGGNPLLKPSTATNFDLAASYSSNDIGLFTVNVFYKEISNLIYTMTNFQPFLTLPVIGAPAGFRDRLPGMAYFDTTYAKTVSLKWTSSSALNSNIPINDPEKAFLRGIELSWQTHLWYLPWVFSGIVLDLNVSFMSSNQIYPYFQTIKVGGTAINPINELVYQTRSGQLQDQPKATYNAILGWDYKGFSSRFSFRYQQVTLTSLDTQYELRDSYYDNVLLVDITLKQQIIDNLSIFADVTNINSHIDNYYLSYYNGNNGTSGNLPTSQQTYGLNAQLGLSFYY